MLYDRIIERVPNTKQTAFDDLTLNVTLFTLSRSNGIFDGPIKRESFIMQYNSPEHSIRLFRCWMSRWTTLQLSPAYGLNIA